MSLDHEPVYVDPYAEGLQAAKEGNVTVGLLALPAELMAERLAYSAHDWRRFRLGALHAMMETAA